MREFKGLPSYEENEGSLSKLEMIASLYIPQMKAVIKGLRKEVLEFYFKLHNSIPSREETEKRKEALADLGRLGRQVESRVQEAKLILEQHSDDLFSQAQGREPRQD